MPKIKVFVVEDESIVSKDIQNSLLKLDYEVVGNTSSGEKALEKIKDISVDIVLMDIMLKGDMNGIEAAEVIKNDYSIPIIFLTAYADEDTLSKAKITEPYGYILKPFKEIDLQLSIDGVNDRYEYIRYPAKTDLLETNVQKYQCKELLLDNFRLSVSHTLSAYNVYYLGEFFDWCERKRLPRPWVGKVHIPKHMRPDVFPSIIRKQIAQHMRTSKHTDVHTWADYLEKNSSDEYYMDWIKYKNKLSNVYPILEPWIKEFNYE